MGRYNISIILRVDGLIGKMTGTVYGGAGQYRAIVLLDHRPRVLSSIDATNILPWGPVGMVHSTI